MEDKAPKIDRFRLKEKRFINDLTPNLVRGILPPTTNVGSLSRWRPGSWARTGPVFPPNKRFALVILPRLKPGLLGSSEGTTAPPPRRLYPSPKTKIFLAALTSRQSTYPQVQTWVRTLSDFSIIRPHPEHRWLVKWGGTATIKKRPAFSALTFENDRCNRLSVVSTNTAGRSGRRLLPCSLSCWNRLRWLPVAL